MRPLLRLCAIVILSIGMVAGGHAQVDRQHAASEAVSAGILRAHDIPVLQARERAVREYLQGHPEACAAMKLHKTSAWNFNVNSTHTWYADDLTGNPRYQVPATCRARGTNCYVFVEDASWGTRVTQAAVDSFVVAFDQRTPANAAKGIFQMDVDAFGTPPDVDGDPRIVILMLDIRDGYTPGTGFVAGYFTSFNEIPKSTPGYSTSNEAEIYFMDCDPLPLSSPSGLTTGLATLAHEFQHMIHFNYDNSEIRFMNESCSLVAEVQCGYPLYSQAGYAGESNVYLFNWRDGDLANVGRDYSRAARFSYYIREQLGIGPFKNIVASTLQGIFGVDAGLMAFGTPRRFADIFVDWTIANMLNNATVDPKWGYANTTLTKPVSVRTHATPTVSSTGGTVQPLGVEYITYTGGANLAATFTVTNPSMIVRALESGPGGGRVLPVTPGAAFSEPAFGSTYTSITFAVINTGNSVPFNYTYQSTGTGQPAMELRYDQGEPTAVVTQSAGDTVAVQFDGLVGGRLDSVRVALRRGSELVGRVYQYTGVVRPTPVGAPLMAPFTVSTGFTPGTPYPVPWNNWATVDLRSANIDVSSPFVVAFRYSGPYADNVSNRVMPVGIPGTAAYHSYTYLNAPSGGGPPNWFYISKSADSIWVYMIRAYVSFGTLDARQTVELVPNAMRLEPNYPNPFNPSTTIEYSVSRPGQVILRVFNLLGEQVATLVNERKDAGHFRAVWAPGDLPSGAYLYRLDTGPESVTRRLLFVK